MKVNLSEEILSIERVCGDQPGFVIMLSSKATRKLMTNVKKIADEIKEIGGIYKKVKTKNGLEISIFKSGKIVIRGEENEDRIINFLTTLLREE